MLLYYHYSITLVLFTATLPCPLVKDHVPPDCVSSWDHCQGSNGFHSCTCKMSYIYNSRYSGGKSKKSLYVGFCLKIKKLNIWSLDKGYFIILTAVTARLSGKNLFYSPVPGLGIKWFLQNILLIRSNNIYNDWH